MLQAIDECTTVAALNGYPLPEQVLTGTQGLLLDEASTWAASVIRNIFQKARHIEADAIVGDLIARASHWGPDLPLSRIAYCHLQVYAGKQKLDR
jgi:2-dehydropantoate 2-reductase